jgi:hypothetical protein
MIEQIRKIAAERNERVRQAFLYDIAAFTEDQLVFLDESSKDERTLTTLYGYARAGKRAELRDLFVRGNRYTLLAAMSVNGIITHDVFLGSCDSAKFLSFLETDLVSKVYLFFFCFIAHAIVAVSCYECVPWTSQRPCDGQLHHPSLCASDSSMCRARDTCQIFTTLFPRLQSGV